MSSITYSPYLTPLLIKLENDHQPLDLSLTPLEKKVIQQFKDQIPIIHISKNLNLSTYRIYSIIHKKPLITIKYFGRYTSDIKYRVQEAQNSGKPLNGVPSPMTMEKLKALLHCRRIQSLTRKI
ncbi:MAG: hypothetical protein WBD50_05985 [Candidatus Rhabdochlamydia sp.]